MHRERCGNRWNALGLSIAYFMRNLDLGGSGDFDRGRVGWRRLLPFCLWDKRFWNQGVDRPENFCVDGY